MIQIKSEKTNNLIKFFSKGDIQIANRYIKRCSTSLNIKDMHIKTILRYHFTLVECWLPKDIRLQMLAGESFPSGSEIKNLAAGDAGLILGSGRSPGGWHGNPFQCSCLDNPMDWGAWWATIYSVTKSWAQLKWLSTLAVENREPLSTVSGNLIGEVILKNKKFFKKLKIYKLYDPVKPMLDICAKEMKLN